MTAPSKRRMRRFGGRYTRFEDGESLYFSAGPGQAQAAKNDGCCKPPDRESLPLRAVQAGRVTQLPWKPGGTIWGM